MRLEHFSANRQMFLEMRQAPMPVEHRHQRKLFVSQNLFTCSHVFFKSNTVNKALENLYRSLHKIIKGTSDKVFEVDINATVKQISIENWKHPFCIINYNENFNTKKRVRHNQIYHRLRKVIIYHRLRLCRNFDSEL